MNRRNRSAIVLGGGSGRRLHGLEKCLIDISGIPMIKHVLNALQEVCDEIVVSLSNPVQRIRIGSILDNLEIVYDSLENFGPLEGIRQACKVLNHRATAIVACDMPLLNPRVIDYLFSQIGPYDGIVPMWPDGKVEPLCSVFNRKKLENSVNKAIVTDTRRIMDALKELNIKYIQINELEKIDPGLHTFDNVNDESSLEKVREIVANLKSVKRQ